MLLHVMKGRVKRRLSLQVPKVKKKKKNNKLMMIKIINHQHPPSRMKKLSDVLER
jgi:hypothetical protein